MLDLVHVRSFAEVALRGTVAAAAQACGYTGPAVSQHIGKLEAELGTALFERTAGRLRLSQAGDAFLPVALDLLQLEERARGAAQQPSGRPTVTLAGFASAIATVVVPRLAALRDDVALHVVEAEDDVAIRDLHLGQVDVVLTQEYDGVPVRRDARLQYRPLVTDRLRLVLPAGRRRSTALADLGDEAWLFNGDGTRCTAAARSLLAGAGLDPPASGVVADNDTLLALVAAGHGVTIVPELVIGRGRPGVTVTTEDLGVSRTILAVTRAVAPAAERLVELLAGAPDPAR
jgi:DNA-binding transcriptional LysR family regulator